MRKTAQVPVIVLQQGQRLAGPRKSSGFDWNWNSLNQLGLTKKRYRSSSAPQAPRFFCVLLRKARASLKREKVDFTLKNLLASRFANAIGEGVGACCDAAAHFKGNAIPFPVPEDHAFKDVIKAIFADPTKVCKDLPPKTGAFEVRFSPKPVQATK